MICPLLKGFLEDNECLKDGCAWWCAGDQECAIKVLALQLIKLEEK